MIFKDRMDAAVRLFPLLQKFSGTDAVLLAVPRGAVPMADYLAKRLHLPLDVILVKKIGFPHNPEVAMGSVSPDYRVIDPQVSGYQVYIEEETTRVRALLKERYKQYAAHRVPLVLKDKTIIILDDGLATGNTMLAAIEVVRHQQPRSIVVVAPVSSPQALELIKDKADEVICLFAPEEFSAVGQFYDDFSEVTDDMVVTCLSQWK